MPTAALLDALQQISRLVLSCNVRRIMKGRHGEHTCSSPAVQTPHRPRAGPDDSLCLQLVLSPQRCPDSSETFNREMQCSISRVICRHICQITMQINHVSSFLCDYRWVLIHRSILPAQLQSVLPVKCKGVGYHACKRSAARMRWCSLSSGRASSIPYI